MIEFNEYENVFEKSKIKHDRKQIEQNRLQFIEQSTVSMRANIHFGYDTERLKNGQVVTVMDDKLGRATFYKCVNTIISAGTIFYQKGFKFDQTHVAEIHFRELMSVSELNKCTSYLLGLKEITLDSITNLYAKKLISHDAEATYVTCLLLQAIKQSKEVIVSALQLVSSDDVMVYNELKLNRATYLPHSKNTWCSYILKMLMGLFAIIMIGYAWVISPASHNAQATDMERAGFLQYKIYLYCENLTLGGFLVACAFFYAILLIVRRMLHETMEFARSRRLKRIISSCITMDNYDEVSGQLSPQVRWKLNIAPNLTEYQFIHMKCDIEKVGLQQIVPQLRIPGAVNDLANPIIYHVCKANNYCAIKRQTTKTPTFEATELNNFKIFFDKIFANEFKTMLDDFTYSYSDWFNHLNSKQQKELKDIDANNLKLDNSYTMFVKVEKQLYDGDKAPKNRCICCPKPEHKYVLGPITFALEQLFAKNVKGYCGGKNWEELENIYNDYDALGYLKTVQIDGSGFDRTQHQEIKEIIDHKIYKYIANKIHHVTKNAYLYYATPEWRKIKVEYFTKEGRHNLGYVEQRGTVFSGSCDTTLMNTLRMAIYNRYVIEQKLGINKDKYGLLAKGDDAAVFLPNIVTDLKIREAYAKVFYTKKYRPTEVTVQHGLGQIAKYIKIGDISDIDFCSTSTFYAKSINSYKIVRQLGRFLTLTPWSRKALSMSDDDIKIYKMSLYVSNLKWMEGLPIFHKYNETFLKQDLTGVKAKLVTGEKKQLLPEDIGNIDFNYYMDKDMLYSNKDRSSLKKPDPQDYMDFLFEKHSLTKEQVADIEYAINISKLAIETLNVLEIFDTLGVVNID